MNRGYIFIHTPSHPRADGKGYVPQQILVVEKALGKYLPLLAVVHHIDGVKTNNAPNNLVACQDESYHQFIHRRQTALLKCGNPEWRQCCICHQYDSVKNLQHDVAGRCHRHSICISNDRKRRRQNGSR